MNKMGVIAVAVLIMALLSSAHVHATSTGATTTILNAAPVLSIELMPDDNPAQLGIQVINPDPALDKTVTIIATVADLNGCDDIINTSITATITGPVPVGDSPVILSFNHEIDLTTAVYTGAFNMSDHTEGTYHVDVVANDTGGLGGTDRADFTYLHIADDTISPTVTDPVANPDSIIADGTDGSELSVNVFDASGIYAVTIDLSSIGGNSAQPMTNIQGTDIYTTTTTAATGTAPEIYNHNLPVIAIDGSPNRNTNTGVTIQLTILPQEIVTATYDFTTETGSDRWVYGLQCQMNPPLTNDVPDKVFKSRQYEMIAVDDGIMMVSRTFRRFFYAAHRFDFIIAESENDIKEVDILWNGKGDHDLGIKGVSLYIWNFETQAYEYLDRSNDVYTTLERSINTDIGDYIGQSGHLIILAEQKGPHLKFWRWTFRSRLGTDYVKVDVTYTPQPETLLDITSGPNNVMEVER